jgi:hypothetical protein
MHGDGLVDELQLFVYPLTRGSGPRVLTAGGGTRSLRLRPGLVRRVNGLIWTATAESAQSV